MECIFNVFTLLFSVHIADCASCLRLKWVSLFIDAHVIVPYEFSYFSKCTEIRFHALYRFFFEMKLPYFDEIKRMRAFESYTKPKIGFGSRWLVPYEKYWMLKQWQNIEQTNRRWRAIKTERIRAYWWWLCWRWRQSPVCVLIWSHHFHLYRWRAPSHHINL